MIHDMQEYHMIHNIKGTHSNHSFIGFIFQYKVPFALFYLRR
jgi:hypothetical protein